MPKVEEYAAFLDTIHLFNAIKEDYLFDFAERFHEVNFKAGDIIFAEEEQAQNFYLIFSGEVEILREGKGQKKAVFRYRDYLGEEALLSGEIRQSVVQAKSDVILLELSSSVFGEIPDAIAFLRDRLEISTSCRKLSKEMHFDWLEDDEAIYFIVRKHFFFFWRGLALSAFLGTFGLVVAGWGMWMGSLIALIIGLASFVVSLVLSVWYWVDWRNDYYIVTSQRVVWLEKVVGIHESRQDAYLHEILSVQNSTDVIGQMVDYATVSVRTKVNSMDLRFVPFPRQARALMEELWHYALVKETQREEDQLHQAIVDRLQKAQPKVPTKERTLPPAPVSSPSSDSSPASPTEGSLKKKNFIQKKRHLLDLRYQEGAETIYRKHWVILLRHAAIPLLVTAFFFIYFIFQLYLILLVKSNTTLGIAITALLAIAGFISLGWLAYQYVDWRNDLFKVSPSNIFDIDRKPFGDVQNRSASLEKIESTEYKRRGITGIIFNYGTVYIHIGTEDFEFEDVYDPASVQQDINRRYMAHMKKKKEADEKAERDQMLGWLVAYHQSEEKFSKLMERIRAAEDEEEANEE